MIGVLANPTDHAVVREFFELFKTPWEHCRSGQHYDVVLVAGDPDFDARKYAARLVLIYSSKPAAGDASQAVPPPTSQSFLTYQGARLPIYGACRTFPGGGNQLVDEKSCQPALRAAESPAGTTIRIGYNLFAEIRNLLNEGQPSANAAWPALDLHIALLRDLIVASGLPLLEIPPVPAGYRFIACLTHDVDHPSLRQHRFDHTMLGFLYRATFGSVIDAISGRGSWRTVGRNWAAALRLPLVHLGLAKDFWLDFDRYRDLEKDCRSSFFVIPFKGRPGRKGAGEAPQRRASSYTPADIAAPLKNLMAAGCEVALHGIDAWCDSAKGSEELAEIRRVTGKAAIGVRMHWLYFDGQSPVTFEKAGAAYDSTVGYNDTVGYRAGTAQVYKPLTTDRMLELPLHIMDTALFYPSYLHLTPAAAHERVRVIIENAVRRGGCVTVNWHDRSIFPERCWDVFYQELVDELRRQGACFATAGETVEWFRQRREASFAGNGAAVKASRQEVGEMPGWQLQIHNEAAMRGGQPALSSVSLPAERLKVQDSAG